ncbi:MAG: DUF58 domain-containing protein [Alphaproteobacteria bacterium]
MTAVRAQSIRDRGEQLAAVLPPLLVAAERVAATVATGLHGRRRVGPGETFWQFRRYQPGDPVHGIDWRQSAKSDRVYVREHEWQSAQSVWLWCDRSPSMAWRSSLHLATKGDRAAVLTVALASLLVRGGERIALLGGVERGGEERPAVGRSALLRLAESLARPVALADGMVTLPDHAVVVLIGDFLTPLAEVDALVRRLAGAHVRGHLLQVLDPAEETLPFSGRIRFAGPEDEGEVMIARAEDVRAGYRARLAAHREGLAAIARAAGWTFAVHRTDAAPESALLALYTALRG